MQRIASRPLLGCKSKLHAAHPNAKQEEVVMMLAAWQSLCGGGVATDRMNCGYHNPLAFPCDISCLLL